MFLLKIVDSGLFLNMPLGNQCLYFHLSMRADDDGLISNLKKIIKTTEVGEDDLKILIAKGFATASGQGITVTTYQKVNDFIRKGRYKPTLYENEPHSLSQTKDGMYIRKVGCHSVDQRLLSGQSSIDKGRLDRVSMDKRRGEKKNQAAPISFYGKYQNVRLTEEEYHKLKGKLQSHTDIMIEKLSRYIKSSGKHYKDHYVIILNWYEKNKDKLRQKVLSKKMNYDVEESLQMKRGGKSLLKTLSLKRYKVCQRQ